MPKSIKQEETEQVPIELLSRDEALLQEHEEYMNKVAESGIPLWILESYHNIGY